MTSCDIPRVKWRAELDSFSRQHEGWIVRVKVTTPDGKTHTEARDLPLLGVTADTPKSDSVAVIVRKSVDDHLTHEIFHPVSIAIERTESGAERAIRIRANDGSTTGVEFRSPMRSDQVDGMP